MKNGVLIITEPSQMIINCTSGNHKMRPITLQQISELPEKEQRQMKANVNHILGSLYERIRRKSEGQRKEELEIDYELSSSQKR